MKEGLKRATNDTLDSLHFGAEREEYQKTQTLLESIYEQSRCRQPLCEFVYEATDEVFNLPVSLQSANLTLFFQLRFDTTADDNAFELFQTMCWLDHPYEDTVC